ncbi:hypothetical protein H5410_041296 [Solanum commersonii]|uniref:Uncharacterized protein n=1 Tax=Solanum commersonii TaxID=4109 RepID=A0A9J5XV31_SOLCO|nr:hypothetical protein H5410_041296 [Solanum commersonii]
MGTFEKLGLKQVVKTTEETITIDSDNQTFRLLSDNDIAPYRDIYRFMHIGLVQVAFKPLTLWVLPEIFIAALRDGRNHNWKKSLIGTIQTSLAYGPLNDGTVKIRFHEPTNMLIDNRSMSSRISRSNSSYISPIDYIVQVPSWASTSQIRETYRCDNIKIDKDNIILVRDLRQELVSLKIFSEKNGNFLENGFLITLLKLSNMIFKKNFIKILLI